MEKARRVISFILLTVFLSAFVASSLHRHPAHEPDGVECAQCVHHLPHNGHIASYDGGLSDCVLCHFIGLPFVISLALAILPSARLIRTLFSSLRRPFVSAHLRLAPSRAPPVLCFVSFR
jgi:hypothetical protein